MLLAFIVAMYAAAFESVPFLLSLRLPMVFGLGALGFLFVERTLSGRAFRASWPESHALLAFLGAAALSIFTALWPGLAWYFLGVLARLFLLYLLIVNVVTTRTRLRGLVWTMVLAAVIPAWGTIQNHLAGNFVEGDRAAWLGQYANPNDVAFELAVLVPLALALVGTARWWGRLLICAAVGTYLVAIFFTYSRSGLLGLGAMAAVGIFRLRNPATRVLVVVCIVAAVAIGAQFWERDEGFENLEGDETFVGRFRLIEAGFAMFQASPVFGIGIGNSALGWREFGPGGSFGVGEIMVHNTFVQVLAETGLVGFTLFMLAILTALWRMHRLVKPGLVDPTLRAYASAIELSIIAMMVCGMANGYVLVATPYVLIGLASATRGVALAERKAAGG